MSLSNPSIFGFTNLRWMGSEVGQHGLDLNPTESDGWRAPKDLLK